MIIHFLVQGALVNCKNIQLLCTVTFWISYQHRCFSFSIYRFLRDLEEAQRVARSSTTVVWSLSWHIFSSRGPDGYSFTASGWGFLLWTHVYVLVSVADGAWCAESDLIHFSCRWYDHHQPFHRLGTSWFLADECDWDMSMRRSRTNRPPLSFIRGGQGGLWLK